MRGADDAVMLNFKPIFVSKLMQSMSADTRASFNYTVDTGVSPEVYVEFVRQSESALHATDPMAIVISGGLAPTGSNDGAV